ncbi:MAG: hypothetical protein FRX48_03690 [Lasallia pustulata]|uniref:Uncharacterized protein n=1 Tax=Lasallia pustulata TaxID=136370 RepID=A0A5M8PSZ1_9LECA|nr:MAG: hypothetical protein FRX48_03690 [Lasallia pustulata]
MQPASVCVTLSLCILPAFANVEKTVFLAPPTIHVPTDHPNLDDLQLHVFSPLQSSSRLTLDAAFPSTESPKGVESWYLLDDLNQGQRYEVRICWSATQPTSFWLYTHTLSTVFKTPALTSALASYSETRQSVQVNVDNIEPRIHKLTNTPSTPKPTQSSLLFLQVFAAADYYTTNKTLMNHVPLVAVDIILDPFLFNILPKSLLPTGAYLIVLAVGAWFLSEFVWQHLYRLSQNKGARQGSQRGGDNDGIALDSLSKKVS